MFSKKDLGQQSEQLAASYLRKQGLRVLETNFSGPRGEIDIIAQEGQTLVFVEVRSKTQAVHGLPEETVDAAKQQRLRHTAAAYLHKTGRQEDYCRFDVVGILWENGKAKITHYRDAF